MARFYIDLYDPIHSTERKIAIDSAIYKFFIFNMVGNGNVYSS